MSGAEIASGPFGGMLAIEWLQVVAGTPTILMMLVLVLTIMKRVLGAADDQAVRSIGYVTMVVSGLAGLVYIAGVACVYTGLMWEGVFPYRLPQNFLGSGLFVLIGLVTYKFPKLFSPFDKWLDRGRQEQDR